MCGSKSLQEFSEGGSQSIVRFICGSPKCISASLRLGVDLEDSIVGRDFLEGDIRMPSIGSECGTIVLVFIVLLTGGLGNS